MRLSVSWNFLSLGFDGKTVFDCVVYPRGFRLFGAVVGGHVHKTSRTNRNAHPTNWGCWFRLLLRAWVQRNCWTDEDEIGKMNLRVMGVWGFRDTSRRLRVFRPNEIRRCLTATSVARPMGFPALGCPVLNKIRWCLSEGDCYDFTI